MSHFYIVDDDILICNLLKTLTQHLFNDVSIFQKSSLFLKETFSDNDIVILDLMMPEIDGIEVIRHLATSNSKITLVLISGYDKGVLHSAETLAKSYGLKVVGNFTKPINTSKLLHLLESVNQPHQQVYQPKSIISAHRSYLPTEADLLKAIHEDQLELYYQPQILMATKVLYGVEALVRWRHPMHGLIYPDKFIPLSERTGLIEPLTEKVLNIACLQSFTWQKKGYKIKISVNVSAQNITSLTLPEQLHSLIDKYQIDPSMLVLEVTESALMGNISTSLDILTRLRMKGFPLSIDDFGTGFSSLSHLHKIPFTELKVDRSFIFDLIEDSDSYAIVETCVMLGHKLDMEVVAEGVESEAIWDVLLAMNCDIAQGYFISKPISAGEFIYWLENNDFLNGKKDK